MVVYLVPDDNQTIVPPKETAKISQKDAHFAPSMLIICVGQSVDFLNDEERLIEHNVFSNSPTKQFDLGLYKPGEGRTVTFDKTGARLTVLLDPPAHGRRDLRDADAVLQPGGGGREI